MFEKNYMLQYWSNFLVDSFSIALLFSNNLHISITVLHFCPSLIEILCLRYFTPPLKHSAGNEVWVSQVLHQLLTALLRLEVELDPYWDSRTSFSCQLFFVIRFKFLFQETLPFHLFLLLNLLEHGLGVAEALCVPAWLSLSATWTEWRKRMT